MLNKLKDGLIAAIVGLIILFFGNFLTDGWLLRFLGGFAFSDVTVIIAEKLNSGDLDTQAPHWDEIPQTADDANTKYVCFLTRVSLLPGGTCALRQQNSGWSLGRNPDAGQQRCVVSCLKIDRRVSWADLFHK